MRKLFSILCFLFLAGALAAQADTVQAVHCERYLLGGNVQYGFLWSHRYNMGHLVKKHLVAGEIDVWHTTNGDQSWHCPFHYPWTGMTLVCIPLGNPDELGTAIGLYPFINFPLGKRDRKFKLNMRYGWGIGWLTNPFDPIENHKNVAIGSHLNTCFVLRLNGMWKMSERSNMEFGLGMTHFSNGAMRLPNLGINLPMLSVGYNYEISRNQCRKRSDAYCNRIACNDSLMADHTWHFSAIIVTGMNDIDPPGGGRFGVLNLLTYAMKQTQRKARFGCGIDVMYSQAIQHKLVYDSVNVNAFGALQPGFKLCYELVLGRLSLPAEMGVYLYSRYKDNGPVYNRWGLRYLLGKHTELDFSLKTHFAKAEYFELGFGWRI
ncbi:MAG TPA: acyloxyacyl hydrolase [Bacteroidia bacterium]|nr:acyloxyacyl hydrolase [Bacteroidia bacterium]